MPDVVHTPITIRSPQHTLILFAISTVLADHELVVDSLPTQCDLSTPVALDMEAVQILANGGVSPAVCRAVVAIGEVLRVFPAHGLDLDRKETVRP